MCMALSPFLMGHCVVARSRQLSRTPACPAPPAQPCRRAGVLCSALCFLSASGPEPTNLPQLSSE